MPDTLALASITVAGAGVIIVLAACVAMFRRAPEVPLVARLLGWVWTASPYAGTLAPALWFRGRDSALVVALVGAIILTAYGARSLVVIARSTSSTTAASSAGGFPRKPATSRPALRMPSTNFAKGLVV